MIKRKKLVKRCSKKRVKKDGVICKGCGECCKWWAYFEAHDDKIHTKEQFDRYKVADIRVYRVTFGKENISGYAIYVPLRCKFLESSSMLCSIHNYSKPKMCVKFPETGTSYLLPPTCAFVGKEKGFMSWSEFTRIV